MTEKTPTKNTPQNTPQTTLSPASAQAPAQAPTPPSTYTHTAQILASLEKPFTAKPNTGLPDVDTLITSLEASFNAGGEYQEMLFTQARILDTLFKRICMFDLECGLKSYSGVPGIMASELNLALRSQKQSRTTIEALLRLAPPAPTETE